MKTYPTTQIRNIAVLGHSGVGKTTFSEALLYNAKVTDRMGKVTDGNTVMDFDSEEINRQVSTNMAVASFEYDNKKINLLDTPGDFDFMGEVVEALRVADSAYIIVTAKDALTVGCEKSVRYCKGRDIPYVFVVNRLDDADVSFDKAVEAIKGYVGDSVIPISVPIMKDGRLTGIVDLAGHKAWNVDDKGKAEEIPFPAEFEDKASLIKDQLNEHIAETSDELMEKYFAEEAFTDEEFQKGLIDAVRGGQIRPVFAVNAAMNQGTEVFMKMSLDLLPSPASAPPRDAQLPDGKPYKLEQKTSGPFAAQVFKTIVDPFVGRISLFRVYSGVIKSGETVFNPNRQIEERLGGLSFIQGKNTIPADQINCGDIGAVTKLSGTMTGDTLCRRDKMITLRPIEFPVPSFAMAILPEKKGEEDKIMQGLNKLKDEDPTFEVVNNPETRQMVIYGLGSQHIDVLRSKLRSKYKTASHLEEPRVPYRETILGKVKVQGKHKKQSGGHGQYGDVWIEFEPGTSEDLEFGTNVFGGAVPKSYFPAVEKGLREAVQKGVLAGYPVVNLKATLVDGSYHDVDSSEMAFKLAAHLAFKNGIPKANPVILEPISQVKVYVPDAQLGDIMGDISQRRGRIMGIEPKSEVQMVMAEIPTSEMATYATDLRSMTQGRGWYSIQFARYEQAPADIQSKVIAEAEKEKEG